MQSVKQSGQLGVPRGRRAQREDLNRNLQRLVTMLPRWRLAVTTMIGHGLVRTMIGQFLRVMIGKLHKRLLPSLVLSFHIHLQRLVNSPSQLRNGRSYSKSRRCCERLQLSMIWSVQARKLILCRWPNTAGEPSWKVAWSY